MSTVFIGGSRQISRLPTSALERVGNVIKSGFLVLVGDANGADKAVQKLLHAQSYDHVNVFCAGEACRNNIGHWKTNYVRPPKSARGFQLYAAKDREMARAADFGLMIWDGKSVGTLLNVLRLVRAGKKAVLINAVDRSTTNFADSKSWDDFLTQVSPELRQELEKRATPEEWDAIPTTSVDAREPTALLNARESQLDLWSGPRIPAATPDALLVALNAALAEADPDAAIEALGRIAEAHGLAELARKAGVKRAGLARALASGGKLKLATVTSILEAAGLRLAVMRIERS